MHAYDCRGMLKWAEGSGRGKEGEREVGETQSTDLRPQLGAGHRGVGRWMASPPLYGVLYIDFTSRTLDPCLL